MKCEVRALGIALGEVCLRNRAIKSKVPTVSVSVCLKRGVRENLTKLSAVRKLNAPADAPLSVVDIMDQAILDFDAYLKNTRDAAFLPVPASDYVRVSLRISERLSVAAQRTAARHDVRITDFYRTVVTRYIREHEGEILTYRAARRSRPAR
jgi:hypothetical protein